MKKYLHLAIILSATIVGCDNAQKVESDADRLSQLEVASKSHVEEMAKNGLVLREGSIDDWALFYSGKSVRCNDGHRIVAKFSVDGRTLSSSLSGISTAQLGRRASNNTIDVAVFVPK
jgi:hypothetical protein